MTENRFIVADAEWSLREDWKQFAKVPVAPANYKDPEKITQYINTKLETLEKDIAASAVCLSRIQSLNVGVSSHDPGIHYPEYALFQTIYNECVCSQARVYFVAPSHVKGLARKLFFDDWDPGVMPLTDREKYYRSIVSRYFMQDTLHCRVPDDLFFTKEERDLLFTDKLLPKNEGETEFDWAKRLLTERFSIDIWRMFSNGEYAGKDAQGV